MSSKSLTARDRIYLRINQLHNVLKERYIHFDISHVLHDTIQDVAYTDVHNFYQRLNNPNIRAVAGERRWRIELSTMTGSQRRVRHLVDIRTMARIRNMRRRN
jgi:hypothetical protein